MTMEGEKHCSSCGATATASAVMCPQCGAELAARPPAAAGRVLGKPRASSREVAERTLVSRAVLASIIFLILVFALAFRQSRLRKAAIMNEAYMNLRTYALELERIRYCAAQGDAQTAKEQARKLLAEIDKFGQALESKKAQPARTILGNMRAQAEAYAEDAAYH